MIYHIIAYKNNRPELNSVDFFETVEAAQEHIRLTALKSDQLETSHYEILKPREDLIVIGYSVFERVKSIITSRQSEVKLKEWWPNRGEEIK